MTAPGMTMQPSRTGWAYALGVAAVATLGFTTGSTATILLAALLSLPLSVVAVPAFYLAYAVMALLPGANPDSAAGSGSCAPGGDCLLSTAGDPAAWFTFATGAVGIVALTAAAVLNAVLLRNLVAARRS